MHSKTLPYLTTFLVLLVPHCKLVRANPTSSLAQSSALQSTTTPSNQELSSTPVLSTSSHLSSTSSSASTLRRVGYVSTYWTAFINISYVHFKTNSTVPIFHTDRTETGRYSTASSGLSRVHGIGVEMISKGIKENGLTTEPSSTRSGNQTTNINNPNEGPNKLVIDGDLSGCFPPFVDNNPHDQSWIAVVKRGKCTFNEKVKNALERNASGVLVYDDENGETLQSMKVEEHYKIPSIFTYNWKGKEIVDLIRSRDKVYLGLQKGSHCRTEIGKLEDSAGFLYCVPPDEWDSFQNMLKKQSPFWNWAAGHRNENGTIINGYTEKRTSVLFVSVSFIILMLISLAWLIFYYIQRFRYIHAKDQLERRLCSQAKRALQIISTSVLKKDDLEGKDFLDTCAVCIETYREEDVVRILPCKHQFHKGCIDQWLLEKRTCPMCKMDILKHYGLVKEKGTEGGGGVTEPHEGTSMNLA